MVEGGIQNPNFDPPPWEDDLNPLDDDDDDDDAAAAAAAAAAADDDDDDEQEVNMYTTRPFQPGAVSTPYHRGEEIEMQTRQHEQTDPPDTSYTEEIPSLGGFISEDDKPDIVERAKDLKESSQMRTSVNWV